MFKSVSRPVFSVSLALTTNIFKGYKEFGFEAFKLANSYKVSLCSNQVFDPYFHSLRLSRRIFSRFTKKDSGLGLLDLLTHQKVQKVQINPSNRIPNFLASHDTFISYKTEFGFSCVCFHVIGAEALYDHQPHKSTHGTTSMAASPKT